MNVFLLVFSSKHR